jgi:DNA-binding SARP family transcriptional activator
MSTSKKRWDAASSPTAFSHVLQLAAADAPVTEIERYWPRQSGIGRPHVAAAGTATSAAPEAIMSLDLNAFVTLIRRAYMQILSGDSAGAQRTLEDARVCDERHPCADMPLCASTPSDQGETLDATLRCGPDARTIVRTLGGFELILGGRPYRAGRKQPVRPFAMLKAIVAFGGVKVSGCVLADALWPDLEGDRAHNSMCVTLHRLRELLDAPEAVTMQEGCLSLDPRYVWVDAMEFDRLSQSAGHNGNALLEKALGLYRGPFLPEHSDLVWTMRARERLRNKFVRIVTNHALAMEGRGDFPDAAMLYERALAIDDAAGSLVQSLARCWSNVGREHVVRNKAMSQDLAAGGSYPA